MKSALHRAGSLMAPGLLLLMASALFHQAAMAETLVRAQGRCMLTHGSYEAFNGHCTFKHQQAGGTDSYVVKLDDGTDFVFSGPNNSALQVQTYSGIKNVRHNAKPDHDLFLWTDDQEHRLSVKLDQVQNPDANFDSSSQNANGAALTGAGIGALIGALIAGGDNKTTATEPARVGAPVSELQSLVGVKGRSAEGEMTSKGYTYRGGTQIGDSAFSYWEQPRTKSCVAVRTTDGRYQSITYTEPRNCR